MLGFQLRPGRTAPTGAVASSTAAQALFRNGEQGVHYDPNDLSTLFQDSAGTTPVTAPGQPVGLMLDKRLGLVRGSELVSNGGFSSGTAGWSSNGTSLSVISGRLRVTMPSGGSARPFTSFSTVVGRTYAASGFVAPTVDSVAMAVGTVGGGSTIASATTSMATRTDTLYFVATTTTTFIYPICVASVGAFFEIDDISVRELPGNHAFQATAASRPMLRQNATTGAYYLETDGSDDWMSTNAIDFTGTDKVSVFTGVRKLSDAARAMLVELSTGLSTAIFRVEAPVGIGMQYNFTHAGSMFIALNSAALAAPHSAVISAAGDISADITNLRVNGILTSSSADLGTGSYGNQSLYLFRRGGTSLPFNGHFYGLTIVGRLTTDAETRSMERLYASKTGVVLA